MRKNGFVATSSESPAPSAREHVFCYPKLMEAAEFIEESFRKSGLESKRQEYRAAGHMFANIDVEIPGREKPQEIVVIGAHYDTERGSPGADDNASGVAVLLVLLTIVCAEDEREDLTPWWRSRTKSARFFGPKIWAAGFTPALAASAETGLSAC